MPLATRIIDVPLFTGLDTLIEHKLGRTIRGWYVVQKNGLGDVYDTIDTTTADLTKYLPLKSSVAVTVSLIIF